MSKVDEIRELKAHYVDKIYEKVRKEQATDQSYIDDTFAVPAVREPHRVLRSGLGNEAVNAPAEQIVTDNPQAFIDILKGKSDSGKNIASLINERWIPIMRRQNPNPFKDSVKNKLGRGESYIRVSHNEKWVTGNKSKYGLPVLFLIPDPMVVYASPEEDDCGWLPNAGVPNKVIIWYKRQPFDVIVRYPSWSNPKNIGLGENKYSQVEWFEYWDKDIRYFEADDEPVLKGEIQPNLYKFTPFIRQYSGFGRRSPVGEMADLIVSDIRYSRDLIYEACVMRSDISSVMHLSAHKPKTLIIPGEVDEGNIRDNMSFGDYDLNILKNVPEGTKFEDENIDPPTQEAFIHLRDIEAQITQRHPFVAAGFPQGSSGRQQDLSSIAAMRRYDTVIENTEHEWATAFEMSLAIIKRIPGFDIDGLTKADLDSTYRCAVKLKAADPIEEDRKATLGDRLWAQGNGAIDLRTNLIKYQGFTENEAEDIIASSLVDRLTLQNPDVAAVMGMVFAEESGMDKYIEQAKQRLQQEQPLQEQSSASAQQRTQDEVRPGVGSEMMDMALANKGARRSPTRYNRG